MSQIAKTPPLLRLNLFFDSIFCSISKVAAGPAFEAQLLVHVTRRSRPPSLTHNRTYAKKRMPPKKPVKEEKILLGRPGNSLKSGIVCMRLRDHEKQEASLMACLGWSCQRRQIDTLPSHHQMLTWQPCQFPLRYH